MVNIKEFDTKELFAISAAWSTKSSVRRERMGHIKLCVPVAHIWFLRGVPSRLGLVLDLGVMELEKVVYFAAYIITNVDEESRNFHVRAN